MKAAAMTFGVLLAAAGGALAADTRLDRIVVLHKGLLVSEPKPDERKEVPNVDGKGALVVDTTSGDPVIKDTSTIPAMRGVSFGYHYRIVGTPDRAPVTLRVVTRYPKPGLRDPKTRKLSRRKAALVRFTIGDEAFQVVDLGAEGDQVLSGTWILELWYGERRLAQESFTVGTSSGPR